MKKIYFAVLAAVMVIGAVICSSCNKDDDNKEDSTVKPYSIVGTWAYSDNSGGTSTYVFNEDGTYSHKHVTPSDSLISNTTGTYTYTNITMGENTESQYVDGDYLTKGELTLTSNDKSEKMDAVTTFIGNNGMTLGIGGFGISYKKQTK